MCWISAACGAVSGEGDEGARNIVTIQDTPDSVVVKIDGKPFTTFHKGKEARKPYLFPLLSASGKRVTRAFPMEQVEGESTDHPHQRSVWIGAEHVSGVDFWENEPSDNKANAGTQAVTDVTDISSGGPEGRFSSRAEWKSPKGDLVLVDNRTMAFRGTADQRIVDIDLRLTAKMPTTFGDDHDAILGLRLATPYEEGHGGKPVNAEGLQGWERLKGTRSAWVDWHAVVDGEDLGVAVMDHPKNFRFPTPWHVRDYALLFASPFSSRTYSPDAPDASVTLQPGEELHLRYRILIHAAQTDVARAFKEFAQQ
jgi:hypothetical protein